jgi:enoyl-CoA hydratase/carnithine racemase
VRKVLYEKRDRIALVTLNRPRALNALDGELNDELGRSGRISPRTQRSMLRS